MRPSRLIYVENDPTLRGVMTRGFEAHPDIQVLLSTGSAREALESASLDLADAALLDLALGADELGGVELGLAMRERNVNIGIVVYSQYSLRNMAKRVPPDQAIAWSFVPKTGELEPEELVAVIRATALGMSHDLAGAGEEDDSQLLDELTARQRAVIALAATGLTAPEISARLGVSHDSVRKDLSRAYRLLVPDSDGGDLRTKAVLAYLRLVRQGAWSVEPQ